MKWLDMLGKRIRICFENAGGIDSWGSDVQEDCRINAEKDIEYSFYIG